MREYHDKSGAKQPDQAKQPARAAQDEISPPSDSDIREHTMKCKLKQEMSGLRFRCTLCGSLWKGRDNIRTCTKSCLEYCIECVWKLQNSMVGDKVIRWACRGCGGKVV